MATLKDCKGSSSTKECVQRRIRKLTRLLKAFSIVEGFCLEVSSSLQTRSKVIFILIPHLINFVRPKVQAELDFWKTIKYK